MKLRDPYWKDIRNHHVVPDKREQMREALDRQEMICATHCPRCHAVLQKINVHGHDQCAVCRAIIEDCCQGAPL